MVKFLSDLLAEDVNPQADILAATINDTVKFVVDWMEASGPLSIRPGKEILLEGYLYLVLAEKMSYDDIAIKYPLNNRPEDQVDMLESYFNFFWHKLEQRSKPPYVKQVITWDKQDVTGIVAEKENFKKGAEYVKNKYGGKTTKQTAVAPVGKQTAKVSADIIDKLEHQIPNWEWSYVEREGNDTVRFDRGQNSAFLNINSGSISNSGIPAKIIASMQKIIDTEKK